MMKKKYSKFKKKILSDIESIFMNKLIYKTNLNILKIVYFYINFPNHQLIIKYTKILKHVIHYAKHIKTHNIGYPTYDKNV